MIKQPILRCITHATPRNYLQNTCNMMQCDNKSSRFYNVLIPRVKFSMNFIARKAVSQCFSFVLQLSPHKVSAQFYTELMGPARVQNEHKTERSTKVL
jgi:hypothetical protein